jgi:hypothetical protein
MFFFRKETCIFLKETFLSLKDPFPPLKRDMSFSENSISKGGTDLRTIVYSHTSKQFPLEKDPLPIDIKANLEDIAEVPNLA